MITFVHRKIAAATAPPNNNSDRRVVMLDEMRALILYLYLSGNALLQLQSKCAENGVLGGDDAADDD